MKWYLLKRNGRTVIWKGAIAQSPVRSVLEEYLDEDLRGFDEWYQKELREEYEIVEVEV
jgi:hypothetical protein